MPPIPARGVTLIALLSTVVVAGACGLGGGAAPSSTPSTGGVTAPVATSTSPSAVPTSSTATSAPVRTTSPVRTTTSTRAPARPDLRIGLAPSGTCVWYRGAEGDVWLNPRIEAFATGTVPSVVGFNMVSNWDKHTAGGGLHPNVSQTWAIDIGPAANLPALGHVVTLTLTVDPGFEVAESNEGNNVGIIHVDLTGYTSPPGISDTPVACS